MYQCSIQILDSFDSTAKHLRMLATLRKYFVLQNTTFKVDITSSAKNRAIQLAIKIYVI